MLKQHVKSLCFLFIILGFCNLVRAEGFGDDGVVMTDIGGTLESANAMAIDSSGNIVVAGYSFDNFYGYRIILIKYISNGVLDTSFGDDGIVRTDIITDNNELANAVALDSSGRIVVAGYTYNHSAYDIVVVRYTSGGVLDESFGGGDGIVITDMGDGDSYGTSIAIDSSNKVVVAGYTNNGSDINMLMVRYTSSGDLDTSFGDSGTVATDIAEDSNLATSVVLDNTTGKIIVAGYTEHYFYDTEGSLTGTDSRILVVRYKSDGTLDSTFGDGGIVTTSIDDYIYSQAYAGSVILDSLGNIVVAGYYTSHGSDTDIAVVRYKSDGTLDSTFGDGGIVTTALETRNEIVYSAAFDSSERIVVTGSTSDGSDSNMLLVRYTSNGVLDMSFGTDDNKGIVTTAISNRDDRARAIAFDSSGNIVIAGYAYNGSDYDFTLVQYTPNGVLNAEITSGAGSGGGGCQLTILSGSVSPLSFLIFMLAVLMILRVRAKKSEV